MDKENYTIVISEEDISFVEKEFSQTKKPFALHEISEKLAFQKTASQRVQDVLKYDPYGRYEIGDFIYKEYDESLTVSSKHVEHFQGAVVLKVINKAFYKSFNCEMLEVDYTGGGLFRKYVDYMKKSKTQVLLPSNLEGRALVPEKMEKAEDPRLTELPMTDKDLKTIEKNLRTALSKSPKFFTWNDYWQLSENLVPIPEEKVKDIESIIQEAKQSISTETLVNKFFGLEPSNNLFDLHCQSLNSALEKKYKKDFIFVSDLNWGKWHLKSLINSLLENLAISAPSAEVPPLEGDEKPQLSAFSAFPLKVYLTWREILSGAVKIPKSLNKELSHAREYIFSDADEGKNYTVIYFPTGCFFVGLRDYFAANNIPQGTSLTLERKGPAHFNFWLKKSKKKLAVVKLNYDPKEDKFSDRGEDVFTYSLPNKIIYLERETIAKLLSFFDQRSGLDLRQLLVLIFKNFGLESTDHSLHFLRAYHLVDILKQTTQEDVETVLLNFQEFIKSEKKKGIFFYQEPVSLKEEKPEIAAEMPGAAAAKAQIPGIPVEEFPTAEAREEEEKIELPSQIFAAEAAPKFKAEAPIPAKKEKLPKKKVKLEGEKAPRPRRSEKRFIEEKIEIEESEQEALSAIKEKEVEAEAEELRAKEKKEEVKPAASKEVTFGGLFAEKLKSALKKKEEPKK